MSAWQAYLQSHAALTRRLHIQLVEAHDLPLNDYEVLLHLWRAPERRMRRVDLAERVVLTASGITRLLDRLEAAGYVCKAHCDSDARVTYAVLTDAGARKLEQARETHLAGVRSLFADRFSDEEAGTLTELLERLPLRAMPDGGHCSV